MLTVSNIGSWTVGVNFPTVRQMYAFCQMRVFPKPTILLGKTPIKVVTEAKFLGLIFDNKLSFHSRINYLKTACQKALDILRVVGYTDWGADRVTLLRLYRALVRSKLDYGFIVYGSAHESYLRQLDPIHHQALRVALGAFRTSHVQSLYSKAQEPSLSSRRLKLSLNYVLKLNSLPKIRLTAVFLNLKMLVFMKIIPPKFYLLVSECFRTWRIVQLTSI